MSTITLENVNNHCRACLKILLKVEEQSLLNDLEMEQPAFYHTDRLKDLNKWMTIINPLEDVTHHNIKHYDKYPKYVCRSCYENFKNVNDFKDMVIHSFDVLTKLLSVDNKDDVKHLLPESIITSEISADNAENAKQQQLLVQESLTQDELIIKPEPIDDNEDEEYIMEANRGEFIENDWKMHDDAIDGINDSNELMDNNINLISDPNYDYRISTFTPIPDHQISENSIENANAEKTQKPNRKEPIVLLLKLKNLPTKIKTEIGTEKDVVVGSTNKLETTKQNTSKKIVSGNKKKLKKYICKVCNKISDNYDQFRHHAYTHNKPHQCKICDKRFSQKLGLVCHMNNHSGIKPYFCRFCNKDFADISNRNKHERKYHQTQTFKCEKCNKTFRLQILLEKHAQSHIEKVCLICNKEFATLQTLRYHQQLQHLKLKYVNETD